MKHVHQIFVAIAAISVCVLFLAIPRDAAQAAVDCRPSSKSFSIIDKKRANSAVINIKFDKAVWEGPTPFVYVKGELSGAMPGTVTVPLEAKGVPVEIGLPLLRETPLFSFVLSPNELINLHTRVVLSSFTIGTAETDAVWSALKLAPNQFAISEIKKEASNLYTIELPAGPYNAVSGFWDLNKIDSDSAEWVSNIPQSNNKSVSNEVYHITFNRNTNSSDILRGEVGGSKVAWSGAFRKSKVGKFVPKRDWIIRSSPPGADVRTMHGQVPGTTEVVVEDVPISEERFIVVRKDGHIDCKQSECGKTETSKTVKLNCNLPENRQ